jgi:hypothetical protein
VIGNPLLLGDEGYQIQRSLRFRSSASAYLNRTFAGAPLSTTKQTFSVWVKRGLLGGQYKIFGGYDGSAVSSFIIAFETNNTFALNFGGSAGNALITTAVYRDPASWYHIVVAFDTTQATAANRVLFYINGVQVTSFGTANYPAQNANIQFALANANNRIGAIFNNTQPFDGYMAEVNFIDGQQLTPSSFGAINAVTGVWSATKYAGTYGTNGFYLNFTDNSAATAATIGKDYSGNGNNWTPNNISVTAGVTYDSMLDAPLGAGGGERGNYAVINPLKVFSTGLPTVSNANLTVSASDDVSRQVLGTIAFNSGKFYFEATVGALITSFDIFIGVAQESVATSNTISSFGQYRATGGITNLSGTAQTSGSSYTVGDVIGVAVDATSGTVQFYKNNAAQGATPSFTFTAGTVLYPSLVLDNIVGTRTVNFNFGQRPFSYTPPTGFKALHTGNLGAPVIALPAQNMAATLYTGTGSSLAVSNAVNGVSFQPDLVWIKARGNTYSHNIEDSVRGVTLRLQSDSTAAEAVGANGQVTAFSSGGFTQNGGVETGGSSATYVGWQWKAGGTAVSNTAGSITSSVSANVSAGFSVLTFNGTGANATVGHGLGVAPSMIIMKQRNNAGFQWPVYHGSLATDKYLFLQRTDGQLTSSTIWQNTRPTSSVIYLGPNGNDNNNTSSNMVAYCFAPVAGYSAFGTYTGNFNADGPFVYLGFRPRYIMIKRTDAAATWFLFDTARNPTNNSANYLQAQLSNSEGADALFDMLSNGFKLRVAANSYNANGGTYLYMAFAESPFKNSLAR